MKKTLKALTITHGGYGILIIRLVLALVFMLHGSQKLFGMFGGYGLEGTGKFMESIGLTPGYYMALLAGLGEFLGGLLVLLGLFTRLGGLILAVVSLVALVTVHLPHGFFMAKNGYEYILTLMVIAIALVIEGGGKMSVDKMISNKI